MTKLLSFQETVEKKEYRILQEKEMEKNRELKIIGKCEHCGTQKILDGFLTEPFTYCPNSECSTKKES